MTPIRLLLGIATLIVLASGQIADAKFCGDDIDGARVPCDCGDVVASDTTLQPGDPVVSKRCESHGLFVRASDTADSISLNLNGLALVGQGSGFGIKVDRGGSSGAVVVGGHAPRLGEVVGFGYGVVAGKANALARLERVVAKGNVRQGFILRQSGAIVQDVRAERNGSHGIQILGTGGRFLGLQADENAHKGIAVSAPGAVVSGTADRNGRHGISAGSRRAQLADVSAHGNKGDGIRTRSARQHTGEVDSTGNQSEQVRSMQAQRRSAR